MVKVKKKPLLHSLFLMFVDGDSGGGDHYDLLPKLTLVWYINPVTSCLSYDISVVGCGYYIK